MATNHSNVVIVKVGSTYVHHENNIKRKFEQAKLASEKVNRIRMDREKKMF